MAPKTSLTVWEPVPNSGVLVLPIITPPASRTRLTIEVVGRRHVVGEDRRPERGPDALGRHQVLVGDRKPVQRPLPRPAVELARPVERPLGGDRHDGVDLGVDRLDAVEMSLGDLGRADLLARSRAEVSDAVR